MCEELSKIPLVYLGGVTSIGVCQCDRERDGPAQGGAVPAVARTPEAVPAREETEREAAVVDAAVQVAPGAVESAARTATSESIVDRPMGCT